MRNGTPRRPKAATSTSAGPEICLKKPEFPSKMGAGPVRPARASCAANTAFRPASASASPFQSDSAWTRVCAIGMWSLMARLTAWASCARGSFISLPAAGRDVEGVDQAAVDLVGEHDRDDKLGSARPLAFSHREAGGDVIARMACQAPDVGIVQVVVAEGGAVGEGGEIGSGAPVRADNGRGAGRNAERDIAADADRPLDRY